jgi:hypothetical protein
MFSITVSTTVSSSTKSQTPSLRGQVRRSHSERPRGSDDDKEGCVEGGRNGGTYLAMTRKLKVTVAMSMTRGSLGSIPHPSGVGRITALPGAIPFTSKSPNLPQHTTTPKTMSVHVVQETKGVDTHPRVGYSIPKTAPSSLTAFFPAINANNEPIKRRPR